MTLRAYSKPRDDKKEGYPLFPHKYRDGTYVASHSRFKVNYVRVESEQQLAALVSSGYGARMSNPEFSPSPSLKSSKNITMSEPKTVIDELTKAVKSEELDYITQTKERAEQTLLRAHLLRGEPYGSCEICGATLPENMLVAAHIKQRAHCTRSEKLDFEHVASLMCKLGCDDLFEQGYIFVADGKVTQNEKALSTQKLDEIIRAIDGRTVSNWKQSNLYYEWHKNFWT